MPAYKQCILVYLANEGVNQEGIITEAVYRGEYEKGIYVFRIELTREDIDCKLGENVTHWMPLPEPPE